jgi:hypothetical protein
MQRLNALGAQSVRVSAHAARSGDELVVRVTLEDTGSQPALAAKLTLVDGRGERILPAYYSDNYLSLLPGEPRQVEIRCARKQADSPRVKLRGWNIAPVATAVD